jgi:hypothetical protein
MSRIEITFAADLPDLVTDEQATQVEQKLTTILSHTFERELSEAVGNLVRFDDAYGTVVPAPRNVTSEGVFLPPTE